MLTRKGDPSAAPARKLADVFCRMARRRVGQLFHAMATNDDVLLYRTAREVLDGDHKWLEEGIVGLQVLAQPGQASAEEPAEEALEPVGDVG